MDAYLNIFETEPEFRRLEEVAKSRALTDRERKAYRESLKVYRDYYAIMETERSEGRAEGFAEGLAEGRAEGRAEGLAEGRAQAIAEKAKLAREMGLSEDMIERLFGPL